MNDNLQNFISNIGVLCETWTLVYKNFINQGLSPKEAITHTQGFMTTLFNGITDKKSDKTE